MFFVKTKELEQKNRLNELIETINEYNELLKPKKAKKTEKQDDSELVDFLKSNYSVKKDDITMILEIVDNKKKASKKVVEETIDEETKKQARAIIDEKASAAQMALTEKTMSKIKDDDDYLKVLKTRAIMKLYNLNNKDKKLVDDTFQE